jgi:ABC-2 type transport system ATP-binding protein
MDWLGPVISCEPPASRAVITEVRPGCPAHRGLEVAGVTKSYGELVALEGIDLEVAPGSVVGLLGPNGAGKTTLLSIVAGLLRADAGTVRVNGFDTRRDPLRAQRSLGFAPQTTGLYEPLTVEENLRFLGELAGLTRNRLDTRISDVCEGLLLDDLRSRRCQNLSGGEKRRVHTAIALIAEPPLVLLDEPTVGADIETRAALLQLVRDRAAGGTAIVYTTHYLPEIESLDASVVLMNAGRVIARGSIDRLIGAHGSRELELRFRGPAPRLDVKGLQIQRSGDRMLVSTPDPAAVAAHVLDTLGPDIHRLEGVNILRPSLESVFVNLTGQSFRGDGVAGDAT